MKDKIKKFYMMVFMCVFLVGCGENVSDNGEILKNNTDAKEHQNPESKNEDEIIEQYIDENVELNDDIEVEDTEWIEHDTYKCLRIRIQYKTKPEGKYRHKEDYFLFCNTDNEVVNALQIDYADIELGSGNDFNAYFEDITTIYTYSNGRFECIDRIENNK